MIHAVLPRVRTHDGASARRLRLGAFYMFASRAWTGQWVLHVSDTDQGLPRRLFSYIADPDELMLMRRSAARLQGWLDSAAPAQ